MTPRAYALLGLLLVLLAFGGCNYLKGRTDVAAKAENRAMKAEAKATAASVQISAGTATTIDTRGHETRTRTAQAVEAIHATAADPDPAADAAVLRIAEEAHARALRAACRVQRTRDCPASTGPADDD
ncbi:hypothetical protein [Stenotrophomonas acidaminiphila]|uniref:hypothetical protein n=1 Tax=Stenotrophomonas acidaminiphila TaxID=128780 RepID=UPI003CFF3887